MSVFALLVSLRRKECLVALAIQVCVQAIRGRTSAVALIAFFFVIGLRGTIAPGKTLPEMFSMTGAQGATARAPAAGNDLQKNVVSAKQCAVCHPQHFAEWNRSFHARSLRSENFAKAFSQYLASLEAAAREQPQASLACLNCHAPLLKNAEPDVIARVTASVLAQQSEKFDGFEVGCLSCHFEGDRTFSGPIADPQENSFHLSKFSTSHKEARVCASCHTWTSVPCSDVYRDWQQTRAAKQGITCQTCHMAERNGMAAAGGPPRKIHGHLFPGGRSAEMLQQALGLGLKAAFRGDRLEVLAIVRNRTPHRVPDG